MKYKVLIIGPQAPAIGGIATIVELLKRHIPKSSNTKFINTIKPENLLLKLIRPVNILIRIIATAMRGRNGKALMFCSSYGSFWEKVLWAFFLKMCGVHTIVYMVAGDFPTFFNGLSPVKRSLAMSLIKNIDIIGTQSPHWQNFYSTIFPNSTVQILSPGIDTDFFHPIAKPPVRTQTLLYMGWLIKEKGIYDLLDSLAILSKNDLAFKVDIVGPHFGAKDQISAYAVKLGVGDRINLVGGLSSKQQVLSYYQSADIFIFPSHFEGFPYSVMEAVASGLPCIATKVGGIPDILDNGRCGILVNPNSPHELANSIQMLLSNDRLKKTFGLLGREHAVGKYSISKSIDDFKGVLDLNNF